MVQGCFKKSFKHIKVENILFISEVHISLLLINSQPKPTYGEVHIKLNLDSFSRRCH